MLAIQDCGTLNYTSTKTKKQSHFQTYFLSTRWNYLQNVFKLNMLCHLVILLSVLWAHTLSQSEFSTQYNLVLSFLHFQCPIFFNITQQLLTSSYSSSCHFYLPLYLFFNNVFQKAISYARCDQSSQLSFLLFVGYSFPP